MKIVCSMDQVEMTALHVGLTVVKLDNKLEVYELWAADEFICPVCQQCILTNFADRPFNHRESSDFLQNLRFVVFRPSMEIRAIYPSPQTLGPMGPDQLRRHIKALYYASS